jgi:hypothetical protein
MEKAKVNLDLTDFITEDEVAQIIICQLLDTIDSLRIELDKEKRSQ